MNPSSVPGLPATVPGVLAWAADRFGDREAVAEGALRLSFRELDQQVSGAAAAFVADGLGFGERVAIWAPNISEWIVAALGALRVGGVLVPLNTRFKGAEAAYVLARSQAAVLVCVNGFLGTNYVGSLADAGEPLPALRRIVILRGAVPPGAVPFSEFLLGATDESATEAMRRAAQLDADDLSDIIFTSGTTGRPKGVMATHGQTVRAFEDWSGIVGLTERDRYLIVNPFFHTFGYKAGIVACLIRGATIIPEPVFDVAAVLQRVSDEKVTMLPGPPTLYLSILNHPDRARYDLSSLRLAVTGAAAVPEEMIRRMRTELTFATIVTGYGLTESTGVVSMCRPQDDSHTIATTSGRAMHDVEVRVVDTDGAEVLRGRPGEIVCRGYQVTQGYFEDPDATTAAIDAGGWLHTGDVGVMDDAGYLRITDRIKDMFIVGGFNAYPAEIENALLGHPAIAQVAVVGVPDERMGEVGVAFVVARTGAMVDPAEIIAWSRTQMANYKVPRRVVVVDALPLNASGKVLKFQLREFQLGDSA